MRIFSLFLLVFVFAAPQAFAIKDLMSLCERNLTVAKDHEIKLGADQIALHGNLNTYWAPEMEHQMGWIITEDFIQQKISPNGMDYVYFLSPGDRVFILDHQGAVIASGYYGENVEMTKRDMAGFEFEVFSNVPYLFHDATLTHPVVLEKPLRDSFVGHARAVVVKTLKQQEQDDLKKRLEPWFKRYEINRGRDDRFVRVGRRRAFELAHFQTAMTGSVSLDYAKQNFQMMDVETGELNPGPEFHVFKYNLQSAGGATALQQGDYLMLLDEKGLVLSEGEIGSKTFPWYSDEDEVAKAVQERFKNVHSAFVAKIKLRQFD